MNRVQRIERAIGIHATVRRSPAGCGKSRTESAARGEDLGRKAESRSEDFFARLTTLQKLTHFREKSRAIGSPLQGTHHFGGFLIQFAAGQVLFQHLVLKSNIRLRQFFGAILDLLLEILLIELLLFDIRAGTKPLRDDSLVIPHWDSAIEIPPISSGRVVQSVFEFECVAGANAGSPPLG